MGQEDSVSCDGDSVRCRIRDPARMDASDCGTPAWRRFSAVCQASDTRHSAACVLCRSFSVLQPDCRFDLLLYFCRCDSASFHRALYGGDEYRGNGYAAGVQSLGDAFGDGSSAVGLYRGRDYLFCDVHADVRFCEGGEVPAGETS